MQQQWPSSKSTKKKNVVSSSSSSEPVKKIMNKKLDRYSKKDVDEEFIKMEPREHVLARPDMYIGSTEMSIKESHWIFKEGSGFVRKDICFVPGLYKNF